jgi:hypothetical protein
MKYWGYLVAKLVALGGVLYGLLWLAAINLPKPKPFMTVVDSSAADGKKTVYLPELGLTLVLLILLLIGAALLWAVVWDQRRRCRTCLRRLRMPILTGSWTHILLGRPRTEYICPYGHGTLKVEELQLTGHQEADWQPHEDMWKELFSLDESDLDETKK